MYTKRTYRKPREQLGSSYFPIGGLSVTRTLLYIYEKVHMHQNIKQLESQQTYHLGPGRDK